MRKPGARYPIYVRTINRTQFLLPKEAANSIASVKSGRWPAVVEVGYRPGERNGKNQ